MRALSMSPTLLPSNWMLPPWPEIFPSPPPSAALQVFPCPGGRGSPLASTSPAIRLMPVVASIWICPPIAPLAVVRLLASSVMSLVALNTILPASLRVTLSALTMPFCWIRLA